jgi:hypothetical protein
MTADNSSSVGTAMSYDIYFCGVHPVALNEIVINK